MAVSPGKPDPSANPNPFAIIESRQYMGGIVLNVLLNAASALLGPKHLVGLL